MNTAFEIVGLDSLLKKRDHIVSRLNRFKTCLDLIEETKDISQLKFRLSKFEQCWFDFESVQMEIELLTDRETSKSDKFENDFFELLAKANQSYNIKGNSEKHPLMSKEEPGVNIGLPIINTKSSLG